jgi:hypothetical protein
MKRTLRLRNRLFDHNISISLKLSISDVLKVYNNIEEVDEISTRKLSEIVTKTLNVTSKFAEASISTYKVLFEEEEEEEGDMNKIDVKRYCIYLITQTYRRPVSRLSSEKIRDSFPFSSTAGGDGGDPTRTPISKNQKKKKKSRYPSPQPSPPSPRYNVLKLRSNDNTARIGFFRKCLPDILNILASKTNRVHREDVDRLSTIIDSENTKRLSSLYDGDWECESKLGEDTMSIAELKRWVEKCLVVNEETNRDAIVVSHKSGGHHTIVVNDDDNKILRNLVIQNCTNVRIHVPGHVRFASVIGCNRCTVLIGAVSKICSVEHCEHVDVTIATRSLRVLNTVHSTLYSFCATRPLLLGDCRSIRLAPHNLIRSKMSRNVVRAAKLFFNHDREGENNMNFWNRAFDFTSLSSHYSHPPLSPSSPTTSKASAFSELPCSDFVTFALSGATTSPSPDDDKIDAKTDSSRHHHQHHHSRTLFPLPREYVSALQERRKRVADLRKMITSAGLNRDQQKDIQDAIVSRFEKWLLKSSKHGMSLLDN